MMAAYTHIMANTMKHMSACTKKIITSIFIPSKKKESRYERMDVLGTIQPEELPGWAKHGLTTIRQEQAKKKGRER